MFKAVGLASVWQEAILRHRTVPGEQGASYKTGPSREKVALGDFRGCFTEKPACGIEPWEEECSIGGEGMKGAVSEVRLRGF